MFQCIIHVLISPAAIQLAKYVIGLSTSSAFEDTELCLVDSNNF